MMLTNARGLMHEFHCIIKSVDKANTPAKLSANIMSKFDIITKRKEVIRMEPFVWFAIWVIGVLFFWGFVFAAR
jgi:hypothetical protein